MNSSNLLKLHEDSKKLPLGKLEQEVLIRTVISKHFMLLEEKPTIQASGTFLTGICDSNSNFPPSSIFDNTPKDIPSNIVCLLSRIVTEYEDVRTSTIPKQLDITYEEHNFLVNHPRKSFKDSYLSFINGVRNNNPNFLPKHVR